MSEPARPGGGAASCDSTQLPRITHAALHPSSLSALSECPGGTEAPGETAQGSRGDRSSPPPSFRPPFSSRRRADLIYGLEISVDFSSRHHRHQHETFDGEHIILQHHPSPQFRSPGPAISLDSPHHIWSNGLPHKRANIFGGAGPPRSKSEENHH